MTRHSDTQTKLRRKELADLARELRAVRTPSLTMREKNSAIRSHMRYRSHQK